MTDVHNANKQLLAPFRAALYDYDPAKLKEAVAAAFAPDCVVQMAFPFETLSSLDELTDTVYADLAAAWPDLERRDTIIMAGASDHGDWVGFGGYYTGMFLEPWLDIRPTRHQMVMRFHEFYRVENGKVVEVQSLWDIPEVMIRAGVWPLSPSLGLEWHVPAPAPQNGYVTGPYDFEKAAASKQLVLDMLTGLKKHADGGPDAMGLEKYWHPKMNWYGPSGIGTNRGIGGFRRCHQIPFLNAMPDRWTHREAPGHLFGDGDFVGFTAWPGMECTISHGGWLGIAPTGKKLDMRSLDFWRCENGLLRENWVLVDLLHVYDQIGVDVFARMRERQMGGVL